MEADFLKTLKETRMLEHKLSIAVEEVEGNANSGAANRQGFLALQKIVGMLKVSVDAICSSLDTQRGRFERLHSGWRVRRTNLLTPFT